MLKKLIPTMFLVVTLAMAGCNSSGDTSLSESNLQNTDLSASLHLPKTRNFANPNFELLKSLPQLSSSATIYLLEKPEVNEDYVVNLGNDLGIFGPSGFVDLHFFCTSDGVHDIRVAVESGALKYSTFDIKKYYPAFAPSLLDNESAIEIARSFLIERDLMPDDAVAVDVIPGGTANGITTHLLVQFQRSVNGIPLVGTGAKLGVRIGHEGEVLGFFISNPFYDFVPQGQVELISLNDAFQKLSDNGGFLLSEECTNVIIVNARLVYWLNPVIETQEYLVPVYEFSGKCYDSDSKYVEDFVGWVSAVN